MPKSQDTVFHGRKGMVINMAKRRRAVHEHTDGSGELFLRSLDEITPDSIAVTGEAAVSKRRGGELVSFLIERAVYIFAIIVFIVCIVELIITLGEQIAGDIYYESAVKEFSASYMLSQLENKNVLSLKNDAPSEPFVVGVSQPVKGTTSSSTTDPVYEHLMASVASLRRQYEDVYGWIFIEDTVIDYPIVRGDDNDYYLNHSFRGDPQSVGSIYADYRSADYILDNYNTVLYGHNSSTGKMFADVMKFASNEEFFDTHMIYIWTEDGFYVFEPFSLAMYSYDYQYFRVRFAGEADFLAFADRMRDGSMYQRDVTFAPGDRILTLSTCTKTGIKTLRYCLQAKLVAKYEG